MLHFQTVNIDLDLNRPRRYNIYMSKIIKRTKVFEKKKIRIIKQKMQTEINK